VFQQSGHIINATVSTILPGTVHICTYVNGSQGDYSLKQKYSIFIPRPGTFTYHMGYLPVNKGDRLAYIIEDTSIIESKESCESSDSAYCLLFKGIQAELTKECFMNKFTGEYPIQVIVKLQPTEEERVNLLHSIRIEVEGQNLQRTQFNRYLKLLMIEYAIQHSQPFTIDLNENSFGELASLLGVAVPHVIKQINKFYQEMFYNEN